jgi:3,4-dihydroxy 2-butanone 4-phosphate synthase/GTP cyclohydrolase II
LSGPQSLALTHRLRATHDAILVGIGTILADDPQLNVRLVRGNNPQPVVVDSRLRLPLGANLLTKSPPPWIATSQGADDVRQQKLEAAGARILRVPSDDSGRVNLNALLERLAELEINSLMVEGGARIISSFLSARLVDYLLLTVAPLLVGGLHALEDQALSGFVSLRNLHHQRLGDDLILAGSLEWEEA